MVPRAHTGSLGTPGMLRLFPVVAVREQIAVDRGASRLGARGTAPTTAQIIQAVLTLRSLTTTRANDTVVTRTKNIAVVVCIALPPFFGLPRHLPGPAELGAPRFMPVTNYPSTSEEKPCFPSPTHRRGENERNQAGSKPRTSPYGADRAQVQEGFEQRPVIPPKSPLSVAIFESSEDVSCSSATSRCCVARQAVGTGRCHV